MLLPLFGLIWALTQFGILFAHWITLTRAVSAGARHASVCRFGPGDDPKTVVVNDAPGLGLSTSDVTVSQGWPCSGATSGVTTVTVTVSGKPCQNFKIPLFPGVSPTAFTICLSAHSTEQVE
jgi:hypothetical protein